MKRLLIFLLSIFNLYSITLSGPLATVKLTDTEIVNKSSVKQKIKLLESQKGSKLTDQEKKSLVDGEVNSILILQDAKKNGIEVLEQEVNAEIDKIKAQQGITQDQFETYIKENTGIAYKDYFQNFKNSLIQQKYILKKNPNLSKELKQPSNKEVETLYQKNAASYVSPAMIRIEQLFINTAGMSSAEKDNAKKKMYSFYNQIKKGGKKVFDSLISKSLDDVSYEGGDAGYIPLSDNYKAPYVNTFGESFYDKVTSLSKEGAFTSILSSKVGYHIIFLKEKRDPKLLKLSDPVSPGQKVTVKDYIVNMLMNQKQQELIINTTKKIVEDLRKKATIKINQNELKTL